MHAGGMITLSHIQSPTRSGLSVVQHQLIDSEILGPWRARCHFEKATEHAATPRALEALLSSVVSKVKSRPDDWRRHADRRFVLTDLAA